MAKGWTEERRRAQAERCRANKPWTKSTGPKTPEGKARAALNAYQHGNRCRVYDQVRHVLWLQREFMRLAVGTIEALGANELKEAQKKSRKIKGEAPRSLKNPPTN